MENNIPEQFHTALDIHDAGYDPVVVIISPPRCSSTAFSRIFWQHPAIRYYAHEPFEVTYYRNQGLDYVVEQLQHPLDLAAIDAARVIDPVPTGANGFANGAIRRGRAGIRIGITNRNLSIGNAWRVPRHGGTRP